MKNDIPNDNSFQRENHVSTFNAIAPINMPQIVEILYSVRQRLTYST